MNQNTLNSTAIGILQALGVILFIIGVVYVIYLSSTIILYTITAGVLSLIFRPLKVFLKNKLKLNSNIASIIVLLVGGLILYSLFALFIPLLVRQANNLALLDTEVFRQNIDTQYKLVTSYLKNNGISFDTTKLVENIFNFLDYKRIPDLFNIIISALSSILVAIFSILFISFFFVKDGNLFESIILAPINDKLEARVKKSFVSIKDLLSHYFIGLLVQIFIMFVLYSIILMIFDVKDAFIIALLCAFFNLIPYVGPLMGFILMMSLSLIAKIQLDFHLEVWPDLKWIAGLYLIAQLIDNFVSQPLIYANSVKSHPLEIFLVILISGSLFGIKGMLFAIPVYTVMKVIGKEFFSEFKIIRALTKNV